jgi:hypothetical protein
MKRGLTRAVLLAVLILSAQLTYPCSWAVGFFYQVTSLRGIVVGMEWGWPRWIWQRVTRANVRMRLYEYRWPVHDWNERPLVKTLETHPSGRFDFGL